MLPFTLQGDLHKKCKRITIEEPFMQHQTGRSGASHPTRDTFEQIMCLLQATIPVLLITTRKRSLGQGNMFTGVFLSTGGVPSPRGVAWSRGVCSCGGTWWRPTRRLLLWAVRILLECILVHLNNNNEPPLGLTKEKIRKRVVANPLLVQVNT